MAGIVPLKSAAMARYMNEHIAGIRVPDAIIARLERTPKDDRKKVSVEIAAELAHALKGLCQGVHLTPLGWDDVVPQIVEAAELR